MTLSWNEIKDRATRFSKEWAGASNEDADAKPFLVDFFSVFGINQRRVSTFEHRIRKLDDRDGKIDMLWKGTILVEMKSRGKSLDRAYSQAQEYMHGLKDHELPKYILVSDFANFRLYDLEEDTTVEFRLDELRDNVNRFGFLIGYQKKVYKEQDPVNIQAAELMGRLHDRLKEIGYQGHPLELYLVRLLFCLFAEDTTIFEKQQFQDFIEQRTNEDGSDLAGRLQELFQVLNTPTESRFTNLDEQLAAFPYVNGRLFEEMLPFASFDSAMRKALLECTYIDWSKISPAIFGSMFQSVMNPVERRNLGAHYTSETNILKLIKPLFLDELWAEYEAVKGNRYKLAEFHKKLSRLKFLDPACGCGNFLVITYRELRLLEIEVLRGLYKAGFTQFDIGEIVRLDVDQFFGIEYEEFPARIAEVAMWLIDHQMNMLISNEFGQYFVRLPLNKAANIHHGDALEIDWGQIVATDELSYIIGNPPFIGSKMMKQEQRDQITRLFGNAPGSGILDYVTGWYVKAAMFIQGTGIKVAFVSTNSIVQGEQTSVLWGALLSRYGIKIHFAHRTFKWSNEARGNAAVYCVIVGFANFDTQVKRIFDYEDIRGDAHEIRAKNINPYLVDARDLVIGKRTKPLCDVPAMSFGNMPLDGGNLLLSPDEMREILNAHPEAKPLIRKTIGSHEYINRVDRYTLWLKDIDPSTYRHIIPIIDRVEAVRRFRLASVATSTQKFASTPYQFRDTKVPNTYIVIPGVSSERRTYIPMGLLDGSTIPTNLVHIVPEGKLYHYGVLQSLMHMAWVKYICGRLKSDFRYSKDIVYNNFPWPESVSDRQKKAIEDAAQNVLDTREQYPDSSLADLYDPRTMPESLVSAHNLLDKAVDLAYRSQPFTGDANRMEFLFSLYEKYTANLFAQDKPKRKRR